MDSLAPACLSTTVQCLPPFFSTSHQLLLPTAKTPSCPPAEHRHSHCILLCIHACAPQPRLQDAMACWRSVPSRKGGRGPSARSGAASRQLPSPPWRQLWTPGGGGRGPYATPSSPAASSRSWTWMPWLRRLPKVMPGQQRRWWRRRTNEASEMRQLQRRLRLCRARGVQTQRRRRGGGRRTQPRTQLLPPLCLLSMRQLRQGGGELRQRRKLRPGGGRVCHSRWTIFWWEGGDTPWPLRSTSSYEKWGKAQPQ